MATALQIDICFPGNRFVRFTTTVVLVLLTARYASPNQNLNSGKLTKNGGRGGLKVSALDSGSSGTGLSAGQVTALCSWARRFTVIVPFFTQVHK